MQLRKDTRFFSPSYPSRGIPRIQKIYSMALLAFLLFSLSRADLHRRRSFSPDASRYKGLGTDSEVHALSHKIIASNTFHSVETSEKEKCMHSREEHERCLEMRRKEEINAQIKSLLNGRKVQDSFSCPEKQETLRKEQPIPKEAVLMGVDRALSVDLIREDFQDISPISMCPHPFLEHLHGINSLLPIENYTLLEAIYRTAVGTKTMVVLYIDSQGCIQSKGMHVTTALHWVFCTAYSRRLSSAFDPYLEVFADIYKLLDAFYANKHAYPEICEFRGESAVNSRWYTASCAALCSASYTFRQRLENCFSFAKGFICKLARYF